MKTAEQPSFDNGAGNLVRWVLFAAAFFLLMRLCGIGLYPVMDTSEARYAEIARKMAELGNWVVPMFTYAEPFWGKPPLAIWASAAGISTFGENGFGARFPQWLFGAGTMGLMFMMAGRERLIGALALLLFIGSKQGLEATGDVKTDPALMFAVTLAMVGFYKGVVSPALADGMDQARSCRGANTAYYLVYLGVGLSMLAKGPAGVVICGVAGFVWLLWQRRLYAFLGDLRWIAGLGIVVVLSAPWYLLAEQQSPGFLHYFFVGEHFERFLQSGWQGDLYGAGHARLYGTIWVYLLEACLPWSVVLPLVIVWRRAGRDIFLGATPLMQFCLCWMFAPLILFTFAGNILPTYVMPALPAASFVLAGWALKLAQQEGARAVLITCVALAAIAPLSKFVRAVRGDDAFQQSRNQRPVVAAYLRLKGEGEPPLVYVGRRRFSAEFYNSGAVTYVPDLAGISNARHFLVVHDKHRGDPPPRCVQAAAVNEHRLYECAAGE